VALSRKDIPIKSLAMAKEILRHLIDHPEAKDTSSGILDWWLEAGKVQGREEIEELLEIMVDKGWLKTMPIGFSGKIYGVNETRIEEIKVILEDEPAVSDSDEVKGA
jgi:hypothetical protein